MIWGYHECHEQNKRQKCPWLESICNKKKLQPWKLMIVFLIYQKSEDVFFSKYDQKIILLVLKLLLKYVYLFTIGPPPLNDKGTVHFCTKRNPQKCIKKFRGRNLTSKKLFCTVTTQSNSNSSTSRSKIENLVVITDGHDGGDVKNSQSTTTPGTGVYASRTHWLSWRFW